MLNRSQSYDVGTASAAQLRLKRERREGRIEWDVDSSGDEDTLGQRPLRLSYVRRPSRKISVLSSVNPSPRVSMFELIFLLKLGDPSVKNGLVRSPHLVLLPDWDSIAVISRRLAHLTLVSWYFSHQYYHNIPSELLIPLRLTVIHIKGPNISMLDTPLEEKQGDSNDLALRKEGTVRVIGALLVIVAIVQLVIIVYLLTRTGDNKICSTSKTDYILPRDFKNPGIFDDLTPEELDSVNRFMIQNKHLNLVPWSEAVINSSYIYMIELFLPNKSNVLNFLDRRLNKPKREAKVVIFRGNLVPPRVEEYIVSPLPQPEAARIYKNPSFHRDLIPFTSRPQDNVEMKSGLSFVMKLSEKLYPILMESYGLCYHNCTTGVDCLKISDNSLRGSVSGDRKSWLWFFPDIEGYYNYPLGLQILINHKSVDPRQWFVEKIVYNGQVFISVDSLLSAYVSGRVKKIHYSGTRDRKEPNKNSFENRFYNHMQRGPRLYDLEGKRFRIAGQSVIYNNWRFMYNMKPSTGLQIYDLKFADVRIAYEISLQEILVFYTGYSPLQSNSYYYDSATMIGASSMELVRGVDCPDTAVFLDSYFWVDSGHAKRTKNNICVFERNSELPIHRHYTDDFVDGFEFYQGTPNYNLVVRTIASIWNYDYIFDYIFYNNGAFEAKVSLTGYVQSAFNLPEEGRYGNPINDFAIANLHQHVFNYKVDLDVAGDLNRYTVHDVELEKISDIWQKNATKLQMRIRKTEVKTESNNATTKFRQNSYHLFYNQNADNKYGTKRAYRILDKASVEDIMSELNVTNAASWMKYPIQVTKRKDTEESSSSIYAQGDPWDPVLDFDDFIDDESLVDEDLVAWVTMGTYHIPGTEDIPLTSTVWNQYSWFLAPHNYFWKSPDSDSVDTLRMVPSDIDLNDARNMKASDKSYENKYNCIPPPSDTFSYDGRRT